MPSTRHLRSERVVVRFPPGGLPDALSLLVRKAGLQRRSLATNQDFVVVPSAGSSAPAMMFPELGLLVIEPDLVDASRLMGLRGKLLLRVRPERLFRRARTRLHPPDATSDPVVMRTLRKGFDEMDDRFSARTRDSGMSWALNAIGVTSSDDEGAGVLVGVIDSGVDAEHKDLRDVLEPPVSILTDTPGDQDVVGHGTHCAGLVAGARTPTGGLRYGVAPAARVLCVRVFGDSDEQPLREGDLYRAILLAADRGCAVISVSIGRDVDDRVDPDDDTLGDVLARRGVLLVAAAGNESNRAKGRAEPTCSIANAGNLYAVGAASLGGSSIANDSNGTDGDPRASVDFVTPGIMVTSAWPRDRTMIASGTSVSTPIAAGIAAVLLSRDPNLDLRSLVAALTQLARPLADPPPGAAGAGLLQVRA